MTHLEKVLRLDLSVDSGRLVREKSLITIWFCEVQRTFRLVMVFSALKSVGPS